MKILCEKLNLSNDKEIDENLGSSDGNHVGLYSKRVGSVFLVAAKTWNYENRNVFSCFVSYTGARKSEILALEWNDIDFGR